MASGIALSLFERFDNLLTFMSKDLTQVYKFLIQLNQQVSIYPYHVCCRISLAYHYLTVTTCSSLRDSFYT